MSAKQIWKDPVGAAVLAGIILSALGWVWGRLSPSTTLISSSLPVPIWLVIIAVSVIGGTLWRLFVHHERTYSFEAKITFISASASMAAPGTTLSYPLKFSVFLRNDSKGCLDLTLANYEQGKIPIKDFRQGVLQIEAGAAGWIPVEHGADRIAALPNQNFRIWIPIDEKKFSVDEINGSRGQIGTVVFKANGEDVRIKI